MTNILVTGIAGFIASHFAKYIFTHFDIIGFGRNSDQKNIDETWI